MAGQYSASQFKTLLCTMPLLSFFFNLGDTVFSVIPKVWGRMQINCFNSSGIYLSLACQEFLICWFSMWDLFLCVGGQLNQLMGFFTSWQHVLRCKTFSCLIMLCKLDKISVKSPVILLVLHLERLVTFRRTICGVIKESDNQLSF